MSGPAYCPMCALGDQGGLQNRENVWMSDGQADIIETISVSAEVVETAPIVLRETDQRRLVFLPQLVDRPDPLRGSFVWQRKRRDEAWEDIRTESFTSMKSGEGWVLELHSEEATALLDGLLARRALFEKHGIRWGSRSFVDTESLPDLVRSVIESPSSELAEVLAGLEPEQVVALGRRVDLSYRRAVLGVVALDVRVARRGMRAS
jgi:hypothetical protein